MFSEKALPGDCLKLTSLEQHSAWLEQGSNALQSKHPLTVTRPLIVNP